MKKIILISALFMARMPLASAYGTTTDYGTSTEYKKGTLTVKTWYCPQINESNKLLDKADSDSKLYSIMGVRLKSESPSDLSIELEQKQLRFTNKGKLYLNSLEIAQVNPNIIKQKMREACDRSVETAASQHMGLPDIAEFKVDIAFNLPIKLQREHSKIECDSKDYKVTGFIKTLNEAGELVTQQAHLARLTADSKTENCVSATLIFGEVLTVVQNLKSEPPPTYYQSSYTISAEAWRGHDGSWIGQNGKRQYSGPWGGKK